MLKSYKYYPPTDNPPQNQFTDELTENEFINNEDYQETDVNNNQQDQQNDDAGMEVCPNCDRRFFSGRLALHLKGCKPNKPQKPLKKREDDQHKIPSTTNTQNNQKINKVNSSKQPEYKKPSTEDLDLEEQQSQPKSSQLLQKSSINQPASTYENNDDDKDDNYNHLNIKQNEDEDQYNQPAPNQDDDRVSCPSCGRKFNKDRISVHADACQKSLKKRPVFDSQTKRAPEDENGQTLVNKKSSAPSKPPKAIVASKQESNRPDNRENIQEPDNSEQKKKKKVPKWKLEHEHFINNIRYNKQIQELNGVDIKTIKPPNDDLNSEYVYCQYCQRKFAPKTAERHIPKCKDLIHRPKPPRSQSTKPDKNIIVQSEQNHQKEEKQKKIVINKKQSSLQQINSSFNNDEQDETSCKSNKNQSNSIANSIVQDNHNFKTTNYDSFSQRTEGDQSKAISSQMLSPECKSPKSFTNCDKKGETSQKLYKPNGLLPEIPVKKSTDVNFYNTLQRNNSQNKSQTQKLMDTKYSTNSNMQGQIFKNNVDMLQRVQNIPQITCQYCDRKFAPRAAERHIPICKNIINRAKPLSDIQHHETQRGGSERIQRKQIQTTSQIKQSQVSPAKTMNITSVNAFKPPLSQTNEFMGDQQMVHFCTNCGAKFNIGHKYCGYCGKKKLN